MKQDETFPKQVRLLRQADFDAVYRGQAFAADEFLVVQAAPNGLGRTRLGLSIGRKVGNAVVRNRWKRVIREAFRKQRTELPGGLDLVVRPRKGSVCKFAEVSSSLQQLAHRLARKLKIQNPGKKK